MKIAQVISTPPFAWATGGCARVVYELSKELTDRGHEVTILTLDMLEPGKKQNSFDNLECRVDFRMKRFSYISDSLAWNHKIYISPDLINYLRNSLYEFDIIHLQDLLSIHAMATSIYSRKERIPYIITVHGSLPWLFDKGIINKLVSPHIIDKVLGNASKIIALNETEVAQLRDLGIDGSKIEVVPNGINVRNNWHEQSNVSFREKYFIKNYEKIIIYVGRIHESKGIDLLIRAFSILIQSIHNIKLVIIGPDDGHLSALKTLTKSLGLDNRVLFMGFLEENEKVNAMREADVFVTPKFSGFPISFLEACVCGLPIVTTSNGDNLEWINNNVGYVVDYKKEEIANAIFRILCDEQLRKQFSSNCYKLIDRDFNWSTIAGRFENIYNSVISEKKH